VTARQGYFSAWLNLSLAVFLIVYAVTAGQVKIERARKVSWRDAARKNFLYGLPRVTFHPGRQPLFSRQLFTKHLDKLTVRTLLE